MERKRKNASKNLSLVLIYFWEQRPNPKRMTEASYSLWMDVRGWL